MFAMASQRLRTSQSRTRRRSVVAAAATAMAFAGSIAWSPTLAQTSLGGGRPTVSVPDFKNDVTGRTWWWQGPVARDMAAALANELQGTGDLQVVERQKLGAVLSEQELAELGIVRRDASAAQKGQMTGARYIVLGTITSYDSNVEQAGSGSGFGFMGFGRRKSEEVTKDYVAIDIRVVDSTTGEIVAARTVEGRATSTARAQEQGGSLLPVAGAALLLAPNMGRTGQVLTGAAGTLNFSSSSSEANRTPAAKAIRAALVEASDYVSCVLVPKGDCLARFSARDQQRRERTRDVLQLD
jgi:curli biogenesis system outer membrane secretion channel CsgG